MRWPGFAVVVGLIACSPAPEEKEDELSPSCDPNAPAPGAVPSIEVLGETSQDHYEALSPDVVLVRHSGPQGGQHFWVHVRVFSPEERIWSFEAKLVDVSGQSVATGHRGFTACEQSWTKEREITVFIEQPYTALTGTLTVAATSDPDIAPITFSISVP